MKDRDTTYLPPILAVGRRRYVFGAVKELLSGDEFGAGGEGEVVGFEDVAGGSGGGGDEDWDAAEAEERERTVAAGQ